VAGEHTLERNVALDRDPPDGVAAPLTVTLCGERGPLPRGPAWTVLLVMTGVLPALRVLDWTGRRLLGLRRPMTLCFSASGLFLQERTELSGRLLCESHRWIPRENLARVAREVSYFRIGLYGGMASLLIGTYLGTGLILDGARVAHGSSTLVGAGLLLMALGVSLDFLISTAADSARSRCRLVVIPRRGAGFSCRAIDTGSADRALRALDAVDSESGRHSG